MFSETATELVKTSDPSWFYFAVILLISIYLFVKIKNIFQKS